RSQRKREQEEHVQNPCKIRMNQRQQLDKQKIHRVGNRKVMHLQTIRRPERVVLQIPTILDGSFKNGRVEQSIKTVIERNVQAPLPQLHRKSQNEQAQQHRCQVPFDRIQEWIRHHASVDLLCRFGLNVWFDLHHCVQINALIWAPCNGGGKTLD